jgi:hypothetical protein
LVKTQEESNLKVSCIERGTVSILTLLWYTGMSFRFSQRKNWVRGSNSLSDEGTSFVSILSQRNSISGGEGVKSEREGRVETFFWVL